MPLIFSQTRLGLRLCLTTLCWLASAAYAAAQPVAGANLYASHCANCHGATLKGSAHGVPLVGSSFLAKWQDRHHLELLRYNQTNMPPGASSSLSDTEHLALVAYLLQANWPESQPHPEVTANNAVNIGTGEPVTDNGEAFDSWAGADTIDEIAKSRSAFTNRSIPNFVPVTQQMLNQPKAANWLSWRRTLDGQGYSPLKQITSRNAKKLKLAWVMSMREGSNQVTPLVYNGILYLTHAGNIVQALEAATGELIWE